MYEWSEMIEFGGAQIYGRLEAKSTFCRENEGWWLWWKSIPMDCIMVVVEKYPSGFHEDVEKKVKKQSEENSEEKR